MSKKLLKKQNSENSLNLSWVSSLFDKERYLSYNETISFDEYLERVEKNPRICRTAYQRLYDMIMSKGTRPVKIYRKTYTHYNFFDDKDIPIFGLDETLDAIVKFIKGAAGCHGTEKRILLLHGPVGSSKSTICRLLKKGLEEYSRTDEGAWYTYKWVNLPSTLYTSTEDECPMNDDPLKLIPLDIRNILLKNLNKILIESAGKDKTSVYPIKVDGELNPRCKKFMSELLKIYNGDWKKVIDNHIKVIRKVHSEADRVGIATFQPKDEKNQDATELTGDINYSKLPHFGVDSDPRAFNFDGEFCVANRGFCEFIEMLKLDKAFLYDLLGASQERSIKPKKFSQVSIDEAIIGHSVHGDTPIPHEYNGVLDVLPISKLQNLETSKLRVFSLNEETRMVELTEVKAVFNHDFEGDWINNIQDGFSVETTPNHSVYNENYETFYPGDDSTTPILRLEIPSNLIEGKIKTERWNEFFK